MFPARERALARGSLCLPGDGPAIGYIPRSLVTLFRQIPELPVLYDGETGALFVHTQGVYAAAGFKCLRCASTSIRHSSECTAAQK